MVYHEYVRGIFAACCSLDALELVTRIVTIVFNCLLAVHIQTGHLRRGSYETPMCCRNYMISTNAKTILVSLIKILLVIPSKVWPPSNNRYGHRPCWSKPIGFNPMRLSWRPALLWRRRSMANSFQWSSGIWSTHINIYICSNEFMMAQCTCRSVYGHYILTA